MSSHLGIKQTLELVDALKSNVRDFAAREEKLNQDLAGKTGLEKQRRDKGVADIDKKLAADIADIEVSIVAAREAENARYHARKTRIRKANRTSKRQTLERIEDLEGRRKYKLQVETMRLEKRKKAETDETEKTFQQFTARLAELNRGLVLLEGKAKKAFAGFGTFRQMLKKSTDAPLDQAGDENKFADEMADLMKKAEPELKQFGRAPLPLLFRFRIFLAILVLAQFALPPVLAKSGTTSFTYVHAGISAGICFAIGFVLHLMAKKSAEPLATSIAKSITRARLLHDTSWQMAETRREIRLERIEAEFQAGTQAVNDHWKQILEEANAQREASPGMIDQKEVRVAGKCDQAHKSMVARIDQARVNHLQELNDAATKAKDDLIKSCEDRETKFRALYETEWDTLRTEWKTKTTELFSAIDAANKQAAEAFPAWPDLLSKSWSPPARFEQAAKFGDISVDISKLAGGAPKDPSLSLQGRDKVSLPLLLTYPNEGSLLMETFDVAREQVVDALNNVVLRLLAVAPPGRVHFTIIDPVGLGQNFAGVMHLADYAEHLISNRIWTQANQIEQKLGDLNEHMEKVIQMYLRNEYATIAEYNEQAGNIAEKYHFLVVAGFPSSFSDTAARRLLSIAASGARCGVYTLIHWDRTQALPPDFNVDELKKSSVCLTSKAGQITFTNRMFSGANVLLEVPPAAEAASEFIHKVGASNRDSNRVEVPFSHVAPPDIELWNSETTSELRVPIGRTGATKFQYLSIGKGTRQHALLAGKTGSGKSTLFHVIITNLALWCSPEQVEFYLVDFKKGVEFKCYATHRLPHARVVAIESDREFGLSVLQKVDDELKRRGDLFRQVGVQDLAGYKKTPGAEAMPRTLLMIDEFQEFFTEEDRVSQGASVLLDRIVRQGRAFGIHVILGSQTLGGAYSMARTTMGQMVIRIALQCNEADAYLIMDENNPAPRLLTRPGEGIYNDAAGAREGNSPFQTVWLPDDVRDAYLAKVRQQSEKKPTTFPAPIVFEGDAPADVRENVLLRNLLANGATQPTLAARMWLGAPNSIKGPTEAVFEKQSGNNLLVVGQRDEAVLAMLSIGIISLAAQFPADSVRFILFDAAQPGTAERELMERTVRAVPQKIALAKNTDAEAIMNELAAELKVRAEGSDVDAKPIFLFIHDLQKFSKLRHEDDFSFSSDESGEKPSALFTKIIAEGPAFGIHVIVTCDTYNNINRFMSKKAFSEFEMRILFQMSANDSASLIDNPKAGTLGLHRALLYNEQEGYLEVFRPYSLPTDVWIREANDHLTRILRPV